jgi:hypothetical protein
MRRVVEQTRPDPLFVVPGKGIRLPNVHTIAHSPCEQHKANDHCGSTMARSGRRSCFLRPTFFARHHDSDGHWILCCSGNLPSVKRFYRGKLCISWSSGEDLSGLSRGTAEMLCFRTAMARISLLGSTAAIAVRGEGSLYQALAV